MNRPQRFTHLSRLPLRLLARPSLILLEILVCAAGVILASAATASFHELFAGETFTIAAVIFGFFSLFRLWALHRHLCQRAGQGASWRRLAMESLYGGLPYLVQAVFIFTCNWAAFWRGAAEGSLVLASVFGAIIALAANLLIESMLKFAPPPATWVQRGAQLASPAQAKRQSEQLTRRGDVIWWGGNHLPEGAEGHFLVAGASGSGKTLTLRLLMQSVLPSLLSLPDGRAVLYDAKQDLYSILCGMGVPEQRMVILNPFDARSVAWDMAKDITTPAMANEIAAMLIPEREHDQNPFFAQSARALLGGAMSALVLASPGCWTFRDVICILQDVELLGRVLNASPYTRPLVQVYLKTSDEKLAHNVRATIMANLDLLAPIAAIWSHAKPFSLTEWAKRNQLLILGNSETLRTSVEAVNRVLFHRIVQLVLDQPDSTTRRTWFFLDELKEAGNLDGLPRLIVKGRSRGVRVVIGFQDVEGLAAAYKSRERAKEILGLCLNKAILRLDSEDTAKWASEVIGEAVMHEYTTSISQNTGSADWTRQVSEGIQQRAAVLPAEFMQLPLVSHGVFHGYYVTPLIGIHRNAVDVKPILKSLAGAANHLPRPDVQQLLEPWSEDDSRRLAVLAMSTDGKIKRDGRGGEAQVVDTAVDSDAPTTTSLDDVQRVSLPRQ